MSPRKRERPPIVRTGPLGSSFECPACGHFEVGYARERYGRTKAHGRIRTHIAKCDAVPTVPPAGRR